MRCFVAAPIDEAVRGRLAAVREELQRAFGRGALRWSDPALAHVTLRFYGDLQPAEIDAVGVALDAVAADRPPMTLRTADLAAVPRASRVRVLWLGVDGDIDALAGLRTALDVRTSTIGAPPDPRPFRPHLTLARARGRRPVRLEPRALAAAAESMASSAGNPAEWRVDRIELMASELGPDGARYRRLREARLGPPS